MHVMHKKIRVKLILITLQWDVHSVRDNETYNQLKKTNDFMFCQYTDLSLTFRSIKRDIFPQYYYKNQSRFNNHHNYSIKTN